MTDQDLFEKRDALIRIAELVDTALNGADDPSQFGFVLLVTRFSDVPGGAADSVSNIDPVDATEFVREFLAYRDGLARGESPDGRLQ